MAYYTYIIYLVAINNNDERETKIEKATSKKEATQVKNELLNKIKKDDYKEIEIWIERKFSYYFIKDYEKVYYKKVK